MQMYFDENSDTPRLFFKPVRPLEEAELEQAIKARDSEDAIRAITLTVAQTDGVQEKRDGEVAEDEVDISEVAAPKKVSKKKEVAAPSSNDDLEAIVGDLFDDE